MWESLINLPVTYPPTFTHHQVYISKNCRLLGGQGAAYHHHHYPYLGASGPGRNPFPMARKVFTNHRCVALKGSLPFHIRKKLFTNTENFRRSQIFGKKENACPTPLRCVLFIQILIIAMINIIQGALQAAKCQRGIHGVTKAASEVIFIFVFKLVFVFVSGDFHIHVCIQIAHCLCICICVCV